MGKNIIFKKIFSTLSIVALSVSLNGVEVEAAETLANTQTTGYHVTATLYDEEYDMNSEVSVFRDFSIANGAGNMARKQGNGTYLFSQKNLLTGRVTNVYENGYSKPRKFVKYLSTVWAKRSQYTENASTSVSWSRSSNISLDIADAVKTQYGVSTSATAGLGFGSVIPADSSKNSKLALYADFHDYYLKCVVSNSASTKIYDTYYGDVFFPTEDFYYVVEYQ